MRLKNKNKMLWASLIACGVFAVGGLAWAYTGSGATTVIEKAGDITINNPVSESQSLGSSSLSNAVKDSDFSELGIISNENSVKLVKGFTQMNMPAVGVATTTAFFKNETGGAMYIDMHELFTQFAGTASSSVILSCGTSTATGIAAYTTTPPANLLAATTIATSTVGASEQGLVQVAATQKELAYLANNESVVCGWKQENNGCSGAYCEAVTSTARGYTAKVNIPYYKVSQY